MEKLVHTIGPVFNEESKVLILGSFPSPKSREQGFFYGHPQNRMWRVLSRLFGTEFPETVEERKQFLIDKKIAMWDVIAECEIEGADDSSIANAVPNDLSKIIEKADIKAIFTAGKKASELYRKYNKDIEIRHIELPSTSSANAALSEDKLAAMYFPVLLYTYCDEGYRDFTAKLIPTVTYEHFVGVRNPEMKKITTRLKKDTGLCNEFLKLLPHYYYEENGFHAGILQNMKDYDECLKKVEEFLPYVDNWATSDGLLPKSFAKNKDKLMPSIDKWIEDDKTYTVRFAIDMLMSNYLDEAFDEEHLEKVIKVCPMGQSDTEKDYYIRMMAAWYMATALAKQWESTIKVIEDKRLSKWVHNKSIQKAIESYRVSDERKEYLRSLKIK